MNESLRYERAEWEKLLRRIKDLVDTHLGRDFDSSVSIQKGAAYIYRKPFDFQADYFTEYSVSLSSAPDEHVWIDQSSGEERTSATSTELEFTYTRSTDDVGFSRLEVVPDGWAKGKSPREGQEEILLTLLYDGLVRELEQ